MPLYGLTTVRSHEKGQRTNGLHVFVNQLFDFFLHTNAEWKKLEDSCMRLRIG